MKKKSKLLTVLTTAVIVFILTTAFYLSDSGSSYYSLLSDKFGGGGGYASKLMHIDRLVKNNFMGTYNGKVNMDKAFHAYVDSLGDVYSTYLNKREYEDLNTNLSGDYRGIGITVKAANEGITVTDVRENSPAKEGGLLAGDIILSVNGKEYISSQLSDAVNVIKGTKIGETVKIGILRDGKNMSLDIHVREIKQEYVKGMMLEDGIGYIRITTFGNEVGDEFIKEAEKLKKEGMKALVLDFRNNPGGALTSAVDVADYLLPEGKIITIKEKNGRDTVYSSDKKEIGIPMCVLINEGSASASEVVAGALRDHNKATLVGKKSYGKGVVQSIYNLGDGTGLRITTAKYYTPSGECIQDKGINPHIETDYAKGKEFDINSYEMKGDLQLDAAVKEIKSKLS